MRRNSARGVFTTTIDSYQLELSRDEDARDLLANGEVDMAFFGDDKLQEWLLGDEVEDVQVQYDTYRVPHGTCRFKVELF